jgi:integrase
VVAGGRRRKRAASRSDDGVALLPVAEFLADRASPEWDRGQPLRPGDSVSARIARFSPQDIPAEVWERIGPLVREAATRTAPDSPRLTTTLLTVMAQLAWWCERQGLPMVLDVVLHPDTVDRFVLEGLAHLRSGSQANYQTHLRRVGEVALGPPLYPMRRIPVRRSAEVVPYSPEEVAALLGWIRGLRTDRMHDNATVILSFGLGAGLRRVELNVVLGSEVVADATGVLVRVTTGRWKRDIPVLRRWEEHVAQAAQRSGHRPVFLLDRRGITRDQLTGFIERLPASSAVPKLSPRRLRATWIAHHLRARTPAQILADAAGATPVQLAKYVKYLPAVDPGLARRLLREAEGE